MIELSPKAASLVGSGRTALRPSPADEQRISAALREALGERVLPLEAAAPSSFLGSVWAKVFALGAAIGVASGGAFLARHDDAPAPGLGTASTAQKIQSALPSPTARPRPAQSIEPEASLEAPATPEPGPARRPADRLAQEVAILSRATSELHAGRAANALRAIEEHQRKFPSGVLAEERRAARVQALCALGRHGEAAPELERLARQSPQSPNTLRAKQLCGSPKPSR